MRALLVVALLASACAPEHQVLGREYDFQSPKGVSDDTPLPLVILAHGFGVNGVGQDFVFPFSKQVDALQYRYAMPHGTQGADGRRFWNANENCCNNGELPVDDVAFFRALVDDVKARSATTKVFLVGHSNGGGMAMRLACDAPDILDGVVGVSAATMEDFIECPSTKRLPMIVVHGTTDDTVPYDANPRFLSPHQTVEQYARRVGCDSTLQEYDRVDFVGNTDTETRRERMPACTPNVELWSLDGVGHLPIFDQRWTEATFKWLRERAP